jgi:toxin ParE1/3/4
VGLYRLSSRARKDLLGIARFTQKKWNEEQAIRYVRELRAACALLAERPALGRVTKSGKSLRRMEVVSHVIFYREEGEGIYVVRIIHKSRLPAKQGL